MEFGRVATNISAGNANAQKYWKFMGIEKYQTDKMIRKIFGTVMSGQLDSMRGSLETLTKIGASMKTLNDRMRAQIEAIVKVSDKVGLLIRKIPENVN